MEIASPLSSASQAMGAGLAKSKTSLVTYYTFAGQHVHLNTNPKLRFSLFLGHIVSTKKEELTAILDHFNIQVAFAFCLELNTGYFHLLHVFY